MFIKRYLFIVALFVLTIFSTTADCAIKRVPSWDEVKHIVVIIFENTDADVALQQPYFKALTQQGAYYSNYYAVAHPSQPNYLAIIGGSTFDEHADHNIDINATHLGNLLNAKNKTWKVYAENLPQENCFLGKASGRYVRKHEPFISFTNVQNDATECAKIVSSTTFFQDVKNKSLPNFALYIPNMDNDGHDTNVMYADRYLQTTFASIFNDTDLLKDTLFVITFDEDNYGNNNRVYTVFLGAGVKPNTIGSSHYDHYSLLKTIEDIYSVGNLNRGDASASAILEGWRDAAK